MASLSGCDERASGECADQGDSTAQAQSGKLVAVAQSHHLGEKLNVNETAGPLLQVQTIVGFGADFLLHTEAHQGDLGDLTRLETSSKDKLAARALDGAAQAVIARDDARANEGLPLPYGGTLAMVVGKAVKRGDERAGFAGGTQTQVEFVNETL